MGHTFSKILLHVVFTTRRRRDFLYKDMRPARHFGQLGLDTAPPSGIINAGQRGSARLEKAVERCWRHSNERAETAAATC